MDMALPDKPAKPPAPEYPGKIELLTHFLGDEIVLVIVGQSSKKYHLHKKLLCYHSSFFAAAFNGGFQEGISISGRLKLPEEEVDAFDIFVHWLYSGCLPGYCGIPYGQLCHYILVYAMGEKWFIPRLQDDVCDHIREFWLYDECPSRSFFNLLYEATSPGCKLRQYLVKKFVIFALCKGNPDKVNSILEQNGALAIDVAKETFLKFSIAVGLGSDFPRPESLRKCEFHVHGPEKICSSSDSE